MASTMDRISVTCTRAPSETYLVHMTRCQRSPTLVDKRNMDPVTRRSNIKIAAGAVVCEESTLKGLITIGTRTVIHPRASIIAEAGPIIIGEGNIIEEMAVIANRLPPGSPEFSATPIMIIGNYNIFEADSLCEALKVGDNNILETKASVGREVEITNGCVVGVSCSLTESQIISENTAIYGSQCHRREMNDKPYPQIGQLDFLTRVLPNYHHLRKPNMKIKSETEDPLQSEFDTVHRQFLATKDFEEKN